MCKISGHEMPARGWTNLDKYYFVMHGNDTHRNGVRREDDDGYGTVANPMFDEEVRYEDGRGTPDSIYAQPMDIKMEGN